MPRLVTDIQPGDELEFEGIKVRMEKKSGRRARLVLETVGGELQDTGAADNVPVSQRYRLRRPAQ